MNIPKHPQDADFRLARTGKYFLIKEPLVQNKTTDYDEGRLLEPIPVQKLSLVFDRPLHRFEVSQNVVKALVVRCPAFSSSDSLRSRRGISPGSKAAAGSVRSRQAAGASADSSPAKSFSETSFSETSFSETSCSRAASAWSRKASTVPSQCRNGFALSYAASCSSAMPSRPSTRPAAPSPPGSGTCSAYCSS